MILCLSGKNGMHQHTRRSKKTEGKASGAPPIIEGIRPQLSKKGQKQTSKERGYGSLIVEASTFDLSKGSPTDSELENSFNYFFPYKF